MLGFMIDPVVLVSIFAPVAALVNAAATPVLTSPLF